jgi:TonB-dependent receptor
MNRFLFALSLLSAAAVYGQAAAGKGTVIGQVFDASNGRPIPQVQIAIDGVADSKNVTDTEGRFQLSLSPGKYKIRFTSTNHVETTVDDVEVTADTVTDASTVLQIKGAVTTVEVVEKVGAVAASSEAALTERKLAVSVSDSISSEEIKKSVASDAAGALEKVTGVSIVDSGYVYVRGLGERYSATMLNNAMIPTTEPEKRVVPLDLFPAALIDNIKVLKTYSPDLPGEFSGGLVQMTTVDFPTQKVLKVSGSIGFNSRTTFERFGNYTGGGRDFFGFDDGSRSLPSIIPPDRRLFVGNFTPQQFQEFGRAFANNYTPSYADGTRPEQSYSVYGGNTWGKLGLVGALTFSNKPQRYSEINRYFVNGGNNRPLLFTDYSNFNADEQASKLGGVLNAAWRFNPANKIVFRNTLTRQTDKEARIFVGLNGDIGGGIENSRLRWIERGLISTGVEGEHAFARAANSVLKWQLTYSQSKRDEPDLRESIRTQNENGTFSYAALSGSGTRFFSKLEDRIFEPQVDWSTPFYKGKVVGLFKAGFRGTFRERDFQARRFRYEVIQANTINFNQPTNQVLGPDNIRPNGFVLRELTRATDTYAASMDIYGGYAMVDLSLGSRWRLVSGVRVEDAAINVVTIDSLIPGGVPAVANLINRDPLPAVNVIYALTPKQNLRFGYGRTLSRPDFRELSPFDFTNILGGFNTVGNPNLKRASINNYDARWEWFPGGDQVIAASFFFKEFKDPIEVTIQPTIDLRQSFVNAEAARNTGLELEFRRNMAFLAKKASPKAAAILAQFNVQANFTFVESDITIPASAAVLLTSKNRPLVGQSRFIYNLIGEWQKPQWRSTARIYSNSVSRRITDVGTLGLPDIYQERNTFVDFVYQYDLMENGRWSIRFSAENLTDNQYRWTQGPFDQRAFQIGRSFNIGTSFSVF